MRALRIRTTPRGPELAEHPALKVGREYHVLEIECSTEEKHGPIKFRILDEQFDPTLWPSDCFEVADGSVPESWSATMWPNGTLQLGPRTWQRPTFWEEVLDEPSHNEATDAFIDELRRMGIEVSTSPPARD